MLLEIMVTVFSIGAVPSYSILNCVEAKFGLNDTSVQTSAGISTVQTPSENGVKSNVKTILSAVEKFPIVPPDTTISVSIKSTTSALNSIVIGMGFWYVGLAAPDVIVAIGCEKPAEASNKKRMLTKQIFILLVYGCRLIIGWFYYVSY